MWSGKLCLRDGFENLGTIGVEELSDTLGGFNKASETDQIRKEGGGYQE
jgi:hypothetical protein